MDTPTATATCEESVRLLAAAGVSHFDVDVIVHKARVIVSHPADMNPGASGRSPCTGLPLAALVGLLQKHFGAGKFYLSMEPKSAWKTQGPFLAAPEVVMRGVLDVVAAHSDALVGSCGIVLDPWQADDSRVVDIRKRLTEICSMILPYRRNQAPLPEFEVPSLSARYKMVMPTIELFDPAVGDPDKKVRSSFLRATLGSGMKVTAWVVDNRIDLRTALQQFPPGVDGVVTNRPLQMTEEYKRICR